MQRSSKEEQEERFASNEFRDRIRRRDPEAWEELYRAYAPLVEVVARRVLPPRLDPQNGAHDTWVKALTKARQFGRTRGGGNQPRPWLCAICVNHCVSVLRRDGRRRDSGWRRRVLEQTRRARGAGGENGEVGAGRLGNDAPASEALRSALASLAPHLQRTVYLRFACDLPMEEIARLEGRSAVTVRVRLSRAYKQLRRLMAEGDPDKAGPEKAGPEKADRDEMNGVEMNAVEKNADGMSGTQLVECDVDTDRREK